ncbi:hypothetical protein GCM10017322_40600 [Paracoccus aerius]|nr:hypothetical protein GCM10017322_40600 [Paracoccus aerius]
MFCSCLTEGRTMAVRIPASPKDARAEPKSEDKALDGRQNGQDDEASRKMADEGYVSQMKNRLPDEDSAIVHVNGSGRSICLYLVKEYRNEENLQNIAERTPVACKCRRTGKSRSTAWSVRKSILAGC